MNTYLGIDVGGTHTDAVLYGQQGERKTLIFAKVKTCAQDSASVAASMKAALHALWEKMHVTCAKDASLPTEAHMLKQIQRVTVSTTLGLNALIEGKSAPVGLLYTAGPGMDAQRFLKNSVMGAYAFCVPGGLDHRGCEVTPLDMQGLGAQVKAWQKKGLQHFAVAGKFSVRNACHELAIAQELQTLGVAPQHITLSHTLTGQLNFPRRMAAAYANASIYTVQQTFLQAVRAAVQDFFVEQGCPAQHMPPLFLLKADGGALRLEMAVDTPLNSVLSGPAASVMGGMALLTSHLDDAIETDISSAESNQDAFMMDVGGTTTDMALYAKGMPVLAHEGMSLLLGQESLRTPLRSLATHSLCLGGDTLLFYDASCERLSLGGEGHTDENIINTTKSVAMVFGGKEPTLVDALALLCTDSVILEGLDVRAAQQGLEKLCQKKGPELQALVQDVVLQACERMVAGLETLWRTVQGRPVYTLAQLLEEYTLKPCTLCLVGGPATLLEKWLAPMAQERLGVRVFVPKLSPCANALGAALTLPTDHIDFVADTLEGRWHISTLSLEGRLDKGFTMEKAQAMALQALIHKAETEGIAAQEREAHRAEIVEALSFATLDERGRGGKDIRIQCQWRPGLITHLEGPHKAPENVKEHYA